MTDATGGGQGRELIHTEAAPKAIGPYSQAVRVGPWIYCSGQLPLDPTTGEFVGGDIREQAQRTLENLRAVLAAAGAELRHAVHCTVYLRDLADYETFNEVYAKYFSDSPPARAVVEVTRLPKDVRIELTLVAHQES